MLATIVPLKPRLGSFPEALVAFRAARLQACLSYLHGLESVEAAALRARTLLRLGDPEKALLSVRDLNAETSRDRGEIALLGAVAHSRLGNHDEVDSAFMAARAYGISSADPALEAEVEFYLGLEAFGTGNLEATRTACRRALDVAADPPMCGRPVISGSVPLGHVVSRTQELLGIVDAADGRYRAQLEHARAALATLDGCAVRDVHQEAFAVKNLAILVRDFDLESDARTIVQRAATLAWTDDVSRPRFVTTEALGWCFALRGDFVEALRRFREAAASASTLPQRVLAAVDRSILTRELGCRPVVIEELEYALDLSDECDWESAVDDY